MRRRLLNFAALVSLALCIATAALWLFSFPALHGMPYSTTNVDWPELRLGSSFPGPWCAAGVDRGEFKFALIHGYISNPPPAKSANDWSVETPWFRTNRVHEANDPAHWAAWLNVDCWVTLVLSAVLPGWRYIGYWSGRRRRLLAAGRCPNCGYDLRATPNRCPECGKPPHNPPMHRTVPAV